MRLILPSSSPCSQQVHCAALCSHDMTPQSRYHLLPDACPGAQIYIPRIPGVPNTFPYLPDKFGLDFEVLTALTMAAALCSDQLVLLQLPWLLKLNVQSLASLCSSASQVLHSSTWACIQPYEQLLVASSTPQCVAACAGLFVAMQQAPASLADEHPDGQRAARWKVVWPHCAAWLPDAWLPAAPGTEH